MSMLQHIRLMQKYNVRTNQQVYEKAALLTDFHFKQDRGAFFKSVQGTLNHLLAGDLIWLNRFRSYRPYYNTLEALQFFPAPQRLDEILYEDFVTLRSAREQLDSLMLQWGDGDIKAPDLTKEMTYVNTKGVSSTRSFAELVLHMMNHQTHHRAQAGTLLHQFGYDVGITDFLIDIPDTYMSANESDVED